MKITLHAWTSLKQSFPVRKSEWILAVVGTLGLWLVFTFNADLFAENRGYDGLARWAGQPFWAWMCFLIGIGRFATLCVNGMYWRTPHYRAFFAFLTCFIWYQLVVGLAQNAGIGAVLGTAVLVTDVFNFRQALLEAAASEGLKNGERKRLRPHT